MSWPNEVSWWFSCTCMYAHFSLLLTSDDLFPYLITLHLRYVNTATAIIEKYASLQDLSPEQIIGTHPDNPSLFNKVTLSWNHNFYWHCMKPDRGGKKIRLSSICDLSCLWAIFHVTYTKIILFSRQICLDSMP